LSNEKELIWVAKEVKEVYEKMESDHEKLRIVNELINSRKLDITYAIESLDDDLLRFKAFSLRYKTELQKVYDDQSDKLEKLFEDCGGVQDKMYLKIKETQDRLDPITSKIKSINETLDKINTYKIERVIELIDKFNRMSEEDKRLFEILIKQTDISESK